MTHTEQHRPTTADVTWHLVHLTGELDLATAPEVDEAVEVAEAGHPDRHVVVDLRGVTFLDCAALGSLIRARNRLGDRLWLHAIPPIVARFIDLADLTGSFAVLDEVAWQRAASSHECSSSTLAEPIGGARERQAEPDDTWRLATCL
jgi:anti-anti-sigma factor